ncbi:MAG: hypothetical protein LBG73_05975 [Spirochaetaceae bacterium]|jgi:hypothetical protein|nr:hypothetical protein [Spirochaetaceae bacterium]
MVQYKDSLFRTWFNTEEGALELYNALHGTEYDETTEIIINTLTETLWSARKNDISFLLDRKLVLMGEHQSTINPNMPFRFIDPLNRLFEQQVADKRTIYQKRLIKLPRPEFVVIYNGVDYYPERGIIRLSDAFERVAGFEEVNIELSVKVYNINSGYNEGIKDKSERLKGYSFFVDEVRRLEAEERKRGTPPRERTLRAIRKAIEASVDKNLMKAFWEKATQEDIEMLCTEWDQALALEVCKEESFEEGLQKGLQKGIQKGLQKGLQKGIQKGLQETAKKMKDGGLSAVQIAAFTGLSFDDIKKL